MLEKYKKEIINKLKNKLLKDAYEAELFSSCITLKNMAIVQKTKPMSADYVYECLMENSKILKPLYSEMLVLYRRGRDKEAFELMGKNIGTKTARNFSLILSKMDMINPSELIEQVMAFQDGIREKKVTREMKKVDRNSIITTLCSTAIIFALLLNFAVVVVFMDTLKLMKEFF